MIHARISLELFSSSAYCRSPTAHEAMTRIIPRSSAPAELRVFSLAFRRKKKTHLKMRIASYWGASSLGITWKLRSERQNCETAPHTFDELIGIQFRAPKRYMMVAHMGNGVAQASTTEDADLRCLALPTRGRETLKRCAQRCGL